MTQETKPERQSVEEIARRIYNQTRGESWQTAPLTIAEALQSERSISDKLREENEQLKRHWIEDDRDLNELIAENEKLKEAVAKNSGRTAQRILQDVMDENEALKKRVDSEYNRGIEDAANVADTYWEWATVDPDELDKPSSHKETAEEILKLRRG